MPEYRVISRADGERGHRIHLAELDRNTTLCGAITFDGSPFDPWQLEREEMGPEDCDGAIQCANCWATWETAKRADREAHGQWNPPERTYVRAKRRPVDRQAASQRIASRSATRTPSGDLLRMYRAELEALATPEARAELDRRKAKRAAKRAERKAHA